MILFYISLIALIYSLTAQLFRLIKNKLTPPHKKTPQYKAFEKELYSLINS